MNQKQLDFIKKLNYVSGYEFKDLIAGHTNPEVLLKPKDLEKFQQLKGDLSKAELELIVNIIQWCQESVEQFIENGDKPLDSHMKELNKLLGKLGRNTSLCTILKIPRDLE